MPRKGAATAAPPPEPDAPAEAPSDPPAQEPKPKRGSGRRRGGTAEEPPPPDDKAIEDWTKPAYADDPGEFLFDEMEDADEWYRIMWFGGEGTGKTTDTMLVTRILPETGRVLLINAEAGAKKTALARHGVDTGRVALYPPKGQQLTFEGLERLFYRIQADLEADPSSWGAVVWDSVTAIYQKLLDDVIEADIRKTAEILQRANKGRGGRAGNITMRGRFETDRDDFAEMSNQLRLLLRKYRSLHCHLLITALERRDEDKKSKSVSIGPAVNPALATDLLGYMDAVIRTQVNEHGVFFGRTQPTDVARGKDRLNVLPVEMVDPTVERVHAYVTGKLTEDTDRAQRRLPDREVITRRSLAEEYPDDPWEGASADLANAPHHTQDGTLDGPPLAGDKDDPEPPKRGGRRTSTRPARRSGGSSAPTGDTDATPSESPADPVPAEETPKATGRRRSTPSSTTSAEASEETAAGGTEEPPADPPKRGGRRARGTTSAAAADAGAPSTAEDKPARSGGRKSSADRAAKAQVKAETEGTDKGPATRRAAARAKEGAKSTLDDIEPPF